MGAGECMLSMYKSGLCCRTGAESYEVTLGGKDVRFSLGDKDWETREHHFTVVGDNKEDGEEKTDPSGWDCWDAYNRWNL